MIDIAMQITVHLLIAAILGFFIGYFIGKANKVVVNENQEDRQIQSINTKYNSNINPVFKKGSSLDNKPLVLSSPKSSGKDNLIKIKGINEKIEKDLNNLGIYHFDQISKWNAKNCDWIEAFLLLPGCAKDNQWVEQARILETGKETIYSQKIEDDSVT